MLNATKMIVYCLLAVILPNTTLASDASLNSGDTAWILVSTCLVTFMTIPGLALFYAGLVRSQAVLSVIMQCIGVACVVSVLWLVAGYSMAFSDSFGGIVGGLEKALFIGVTVDSLSGSIPETAFSAFQMTFAIIAAALMVGAFVERIKVISLIIICAFWTLIVYVPICHWIWGDGGWLKSLGVMDFAGGMVVHTSAGISALVIAQVLGSRRGFPDAIHPPHNPGMTAAGAGMLWVGWFGFNGGSQLVADGGAGMAMLATHFAAAAAALTWSCIEWIKFRKTSIVGAVTGVIAGLATVTPASGFIGPVGGLIIGIAAGGVCFYFVDVVKGWWRIDDSLDVFAVHGAGGALGSLLVVLFAHEFFGGGGLSMPMASQAGVQVIGLLATIFWSLLATLIIVKFTSVITGGIRVDEEDELLGLDLSEHGERGYDF
ncbi:MAG: ammonium transporter [Roseovarius sp.]|nr:ammonium transporter [Roseovarius sp.]MCY4293039.1 ammonium transporter [Roseovarius sp.]